MIRAVLDEVSHQPRQDWKRLLTERLGDPALVRQGLLWLASDAIGRTLDRPTLGTDGDARYELLAELDRGATATVWQAQDRVLDRTVAIKVFHEDAAAIVDVLREARAASDVVSDHVVRVLDVCDGDHPYLVMELVAEHADGGELHLGRSAADSPPRDLDEAVRWTLHVARGVADAHLRNVFHRDLNPRNVLVSPLSRRARIADFGLAAGQHARAGFRGTPAYLAPEQARGGALDRAALVAVDIWGIGATARDLIAGRPPWPGDGWEQAAAGQPLAPLERTQTGERIPRSLARIIGKLTAALPDQRYRSAAEVADELAAYLADRPTSFDRSRARRLRLWSKRNPQVTIAASVAAVLLVLVAGSLVGLAQLDAQRDAIANERDRVTDHLRSINVELAATDSVLARRTTELRALEKSLADQRAEYQHVLAAKEHALRQATVKTNLLAGQLEDLEDDRVLAESTGKLYERFWTKARAEADTAIRERARVQAERDSARAELTALRSKLDDLQLELARIRAETAPPGSGDDDPAPQRAE